MYCYLVLGYLLTLLRTNAFALPADVTADKELVLAFVINRHGERTPDADEMSLADDPEKLYNLTRVEGLEGLTNVGKRRAFEIGKFLRHRYGSNGFRLISDLYLQDEIAIRSTDKERTKMTAQIAMAAVYPPQPRQQWNEDIGRVWQPVPYTAVPLSEDYLRYYSNCQRFKTLIAQAKEESLLAEFKPFEELGSDLQKITGRSFKNHLLYQTLFDLYRSQNSLGVEIPKWAKPLLPQLSEAAKLAYRLYFRNDEMKKIGGGVILNDFLKAALEITLERPVAKRLRIFSAHDFNIGAFMAVSKVAETTVPEYGSLFALELYKTKSNGEFSVLPVFLPQAGSSIVQEYHITGCGTGSYCPLNTFRNLVKEYILPENQFYRICGIMTEQA